MWARRWAPPIVAALLLLAHWAIIQFDFGDADFANLISNLASTIEPALGAAACFWAARRNQGHTRTSWILLGAAMTSWGLGQLAWSYYEQRLGDLAPFPSLADVGYIGFIPLAAAAVLVYSAPSLRGSHRMRFALDSLIILSALLLLSWTIALEDTIEGTFSAGLPLFEQMILLASPIGDVLIVALVLLLVSRVEPSERIQFLTIGAGAAFFAVADTFYVQMIANGTYSTGHPIDLGWGTGFLIIAVAALRSTQTTTPRVTTLESLDRVVAWLPYVPVGLACIAVVDLALDHGAVEAGIVLYVLFLVGLVLARQLYILFDNQRLTRRLEETTARLNELQELRRQIVNNVAHDLQNPLTPIAIQMHLLEIDPKTSAKTKEALAIINRNLQRLRRLVADLQDTAKIESGKLLIAPVQSDLLDLVQQVGASQGPVARNTGISFQVIANSPLPSTFDPQRIAQVLDNLVSNAIRFTPDRGNIQLVAGANDGQARIMVQDTGRGLEPPEVSRLFRPFGQVHQPGESRDRGTGLGLYIAKGIIEAHRGRIWVESQGRGRGSRFIVELPLDSRPHDVRNAPRLPAGGTTPPPGYRPT